MLGPFLLRATNMQRLLERGARTGSALARRGVLSPRGVVVRASHFDCTGQALTCKPAAEQAVDETVHNLISFTERSTPLVQHALQKDPDHPIVMITAAMEIERHGPIQGVDLNDLLARLEDLHTAGKLSPRETLLAAGISAKINNHPYRAGALFETAVCQNPRDTLALRLAHDSYIAAGKPHDVLGCTVRNRGVHSATPSFLSCVQGMTAQGYLEVGRITDSEEAALRGVAMSRRFTDIGSVHALIGSYNFRGKSSEIIAAVDEHKHSSLRAGESYWMLGFAKGHVMRGNCNTAARSCLDYLQTESVCDSHTTQLNATLALWHMILHLSDVHVLPLDLITNLLHTVGAEADPSTLSPQQIVMNTIKLSAQLYMLESDNLNGLIDERKRQQKQSEGESTTARLRKSLMSLVNPTIVSPESEAWVDNHMETKDAQIATARQLLANWISALDRLATSAPRICQTFASVSPNLPFVYANIPGIADSNTHAAQACKGVALFALGDYAAACAVLCDGYRDGFQGLGMSALQRNVFSITFIEGLVRMGDPHTAARFLSERIVLYPNDGQTWRRLGVVYRVLGLQHAAEEAEYTAWQQGIGQGGFGGNI